MRYVCAPTQRFEAYPNNFGAGVGGDFIGLNIDNADGSGSGTGYYFFAPGAFGAPGSYGNAGYPDPNGPGSGGGFYGNAGVATLFVSGPLDAVPEPATWGMTILGFGLAGSAMRRRRAGRARGLAPA